MALSAHRLLQVWERGQDRSVHDRTLLLLAASRPDWPRERLAALPIGRRDAAILDLRCRTLGPELRGSTLCPRCMARLQYVLDGPGYLAATGRQEGEQTRVFGGWEITFRLPDSADLQAAATCRDVPEARALLLQRCVSRCRTEGRDAAPDALPEAVVEALGEAMRAEDPGAEIRVDLSCAACQAEWSILLEIGVFFWDEIAAIARRLVGEVDALARLYGWKEADILAMSSARRKLYLEVTGR